jgi:hypothetical protein
MYYFAASTQPEGSSFWAGIVECSVVDPADRNSVRNLSLKSYNKYVVHAPTNIGIIHVLVKLRLKRASV